MPKIFLPIISKPIQYSHQFGIGAGGGEFAHRVLHSGVRRGWKNLSAPRYAGVESVPCVWGQNEVDMVLGGKCFTGTSDWVIGFNEVDRPDQANLTPSEAVPLWHAVTTHPEGLKYKFTSPSQLFDPELDWLREFRELYILAYGDPPRFDALDVHCYSDNTKTDRKIVKKAISLAQEWSIPEVWISEFQYGHWIPDGAVWKTRDFMKFLLDQPMVTKAFWFCGYVKPGTPWYPEWWYRPNLVEMDGDPVVTELGRLYHDMCIAQ